MAPRVAVCIGLAMITALHGDVALLRLLLVVKIITPARLFPGEIAVTHLAFGLFKEIVHISAVSVGLRPLYIIECKVPCKILVSPFLLKK